MILVRTGKTCKHRSCLDLDMHILKIVYLNNEYFKLKVVWVHKKYGYLYTQSGTINLYRKHLKNWSDVE